MLVQCHCLLVRMIMREIAARYEKEIMSFADLYQGFSQKSA